MSHFEGTVAELLERGVAVRFAASGDSMHPSIRHGEHVHVAPVEWSSLRVGDVVLARAKRGLTAHRIVKLNVGRASARLNVGRASARPGGLKPALRSITTRGDNAVQRDAELSQTAILGRVTHIERDGATIAVPAAPFRRNLLSLSRLIRSLV